MHRVRDRGHTVISFGKLHFRSSENDNGFTEEIAPMHAANGGLGWPQALLRNPLPPFDESKELAQGVKKSESEYTQYDRHITAAACDWLRTYPKRIKNNRWALFVSFVSPHYPLSAPGSFYDLYSGQDFPRQTRFEDAESTKHPIIKQIRKFWNYDDYFDDALRIEAQRCYYGLVSFLDYNIGQVLQALEDSGCSNETLILYTSDHGEMLGHLGFWTKSVMYERAVGIPLIAAGPGFKHAVADTPATLTDIAPTIEHAMAISHSYGNGSWRGQALQKVAKQPDPDRFIISQYHDGGTPVSFYMVRHREWKYVYYAKQNRSQLFNLNEDPNEIQDYSKNEAQASHESRMCKLLKQILDPELIAKKCEQDREDRVAQLGGIEAVANLQGFNHTPVSY